MAVRSIQVLLLLAMSVLAQGQSWTRSVTKCPNNLSTMLLLRDGSMLIANPDLQGIWLKWTPDQFGGYENGICNRVADSPSGYSPRAFGSVVAGNGKAYIFGGEYNTGCQAECWVNKSAVYDPRLDSWKMIPPPPGWNTIGDAASVVLPNGLILQLNCCTNETAIYNTGTEQWEPSGPTLGTHHESTMVLMQNGKVLLLDTSTNFYCGLSPRASEIYDPATRTWSCGPETPLQLWGPPDNETGPVMQMPDGTVYAGGGWLSGSAVLDPKTMQWASGPSLPNMNQDEIPMAVLPDGTAIGGWRDFEKNSCQYAIYDSNTGSVTTTVNPSTCPDRADESSSFRMLVLPTGQVAYDHVNHWIEFFSSGSVPLASSKPRILALSSLALHAGSTYTLYGYQLNGLTAGAYKDDDAQMATNYPLVQLTDAQGRVVYAPTHDDSYSGIEPGKISYTKFDLPFSLSSGVYSIRVVTNGIASDPLAVTIASPLPH